MPRIRAFQGLRPPPELVSGVASVPYDAVDRDEASALADRLPNSLLRVDRAEIDLPPETDPCSEGVYQKALANFLLLQSKGALVRESEPCMYLYQQRMGEHVQTGVAAVCHADDYERGAIKNNAPPEPEKEAHRARLIHSIGAQTTPVLLTYRDSLEIDALVHPVLAIQPLYSFRTPDQVEHTVRRIPGSKAFQEAFKKIESCYVFDSQHRAAAAARVCREMRTSQQSGNEDYNWFLSILFPASQLQTLPVHRIVKDLNGLSNAEFLKKISTGLSCKPSGTSAPECPGKIQMYLGGTWFTLSRKPLPVDSVCAPSEFDSHLLQDRILSPLLDVKDPASNKRIEFLSGPRSTTELVRWVDTGKAMVGFSLFPVSPDQVLAAADSGQPLPFKSTCFEPKLRSGLFIHTF
jgi:uncharacterized protein (DUF1015 family)